MKKTIFIKMVIAMVIATVMGCGNDKKEETTTEKRVKVDTVKVEPAKSGYDLEYSGTIEASQTIPLTFKTIGTVDKIYVEVGDAVKKGQLLASVDNSDMQSIYNTMLAKYDQAKDAYDRLKAVYEKGSLTEIAWAEMKSNYEQATSALDIAKSNLEKCNMYAPIDGYVGNRNIEPGQSSVSITSAPIELVKIETVYVKISVPENEINRIQNGQKASILVSALEDKQFKGVVSNVSLVADEISRTYTAKISVPNTNLDLKPGMVCDVTLNLESEKISLVVPCNAVSKDSDDKPYVYIVSTDNKTVKKQNIIIGRYCDAGIEVISGLTEGQTIVSEGCEKLSDNSLISF
jgi:RND family efflux transporter MFP subunit